MRQGDLLHEAIVNRVKEGTEGLLKHILLVCHEGNETTELEQFTVQRRGSGDYRGTFKGWHRGTDGNPTAFVWQVGGDGIGAVLGLAEAGFNLGNYQGYPDPWPRPRRKHRTIRGVHADHYE